MSTNVQSPNAQAASQHPHPKDYEEHMTWRIRWYLVIAITIIYALSLLSGLIAYAATRDVHYFLFLTPTALIPFVHYLVPMDQRRHEQKMFKIWAGTQSKAQPQQKTKQGP